MQTTALESSNALSGWRLKLYTIIFEADTVAGRRFDLLLIWAIVLSLVVIMFDSVKAVHSDYALQLNTAEWFFTIVFTIEYLARLICSRSPMRYAKSFMGVIDLISILPSFIALAVPEAYVLLDVRILRLLRIFRVLKLSAYVEEYQWLLLAVADSRRKISVFLSIILTLVVILGTVMFVVEGPANGFTSVPTSIYWAISTLTTVGFGDIVPKTDVGRFISSFMMLFGWGILAVPTGIVSAEMIAQHAMKKSLTEATTRTCHTCTTEGHSGDARHCFHCGAKLTEYYGVAPTLTPRIAYAASMIYMINADGKIEPEEIGRLVAAVKDDRSLLESATRYTKLHDVSEFLGFCHTLLSREQKLSVLVNLYDAMLANGSVIEQEQALFEEFIAAFGVSDAVLMPYLQSIQVKNDQAVFKA